MAVFPSFKLTEKGEELLNRSIGEGKTLTFTKFELGDGNPPSDFRKQTGLVNKFYEFPILNTSIQKDQVLRIRGYFDNKYFSQDKQLKEIGVFVKIEGNETQYLYSYTNTGDTGDIIPANSRGFYSRTLDVANYIGYATNITFNIEQLRDRYAFNTENEMKVASYLKAGDKVELWGNLVLGDKPTDEYIIQESGEIELSNGLFAKKVSFIYIAQTIEEMQKLALKVGDIVEVLGYYQAGDGAGHKRVIASEDDGSGVQLDNQLWANIVKTEKTTVDHFGAKGDGVTDDSDIINKMLKNTGGVVRFSNKKYLINKSIRLLNYCNYIGDVNNGVFLDKSVTILVAGDNLESFFYTDTSENKVDRYTISNIRFIGNDTCDLIKADVGIGRCLIQECRIAKVNNVFNVKPSKPNTQTIPFGYYMNLTKNEIHCNTVFDFSIPDGSQIKSGWSNQNSIQDCIFHCNRVVNIYGTKSIGRQDWKWEDCSFENFHSYNDREKAITWSEFSQCVNELFINCYIEKITMSETCTQEEYNTAKSSGVSVVTNFLDIGSSPSYRKDIYEYNGYYYSSDNNKIKKDKYATLIGAKSYGKVKFLNCIISIIDRVFYDKSDTTTKTSISFDNCTFYGLGSFVSEYMPTLFTTSSRSKINFKNTFINPIKNLVSNPCVIEFKGDTSDSKEYYVEPGRGNSFIPKNELYVTFDKSIRNGFGYTRQYPLLVDSFIFLRTLKDYTYNITNGFLEISSLVKIKNNITLVFSENCGIQFNTQTYGIPYLVVEDSVKIKNGIIKIKDYNSGSYNGVFDLNRGDLVLDGIKFEYTNSSLPINLLSNKNLVKSDFTKLNNLTGELPVGSKIIENKSYVPFNLEIANVNITNLTDNTQNTTQLNTPYHTTRMSEEGGTTLTDFYSYLDKKYAYDKQLEAEEQDKYEAYELLLQDNPELTWEEFEQQYGNNVMMNLSLVERLEEPEIPETVKKFMEKYL